MLLTTYYVKRRKTKKKINDIIMQGWGAGCTIYKLVQGVSSGRGPGWVELT